MSHVEKLTIGQFQIVLEGDNRDNVTLVKAVLQRGVHSNSQAFNELVNRLLTKLHVSLTVVNNEIGVSATEVL